MINLDNFITYINNTYLKKYEGIALFYQNGLNFEKRSSNIYISLQYTTKTSNLKTELYIILIPKEYNGKECFVPNYISVNQKINCVNFKLGLDCFTDAKAYLEVDNYPVCYNKFYNDSYFQSIIKVLNSEDVQINNLLTDSQKTFIVEEVIKHMDTL
jgi:hypothetical protein